MGKEELSPLHSVIAFMNDEPIGIVLNGIWQRNGKKVAWNGGTGVAPAYRKQGAGQALMEETLKIYAERSTWHGIPHDAYQLPFWTNPVWDIQWQTIENKEALLVIDREERVIGYAGFYDKSAQAVRFVSTFSIA